MLDSEYLMNDIPRGTSCEEILRSLAPPVHEDPEPNYKLILKMLKTQPALQDSELDDSLSVARLVFNEIPQWLKFLNQNPHGLPHKTRFGTIWNAVDMAAQDRLGRTAFVRAVIDGGFKYAEMLAEFPETDIQSADKLGRTALHWATIKRLPDMVNLCLAVGVDCSTKYNEGLTAFDISCQQSDEKISTLFYKHLFVVEKSDPNAALLQLLTLTSEPEDGPEFPGEALFGPVTDAQQKPLVEALMKAGVNLTKKNSKGETALHLAAKHGHPEILSTLLKNPSRGVYVDMDAVSKDGLTALHYAAQDGHGSAIAILLKQGADSAVKDTNGQTPRDRAIKNGNHGALEALDTGSAGLHRAAAEGRVQMVQLILNRGGNIQERDSDGQRALHLAAQEGHEETVKVLLHQGAYIHARDNAKQTVLHLAAKGGHQETVRVLLDGEAHLQARDENQRTALHLAAEGGHHGTVKVLLDRNANSESRDDTGMTALHVAANEGHQETVKLLLDRGANRETRNKWGKTVLQTAYRHHEIIALLEEE